MEAGEWFEDDIGAGSSPSPGLAHAPPFLAAAGPAPHLGWRLNPAVWGRRPRQLSRQRGTRSPVPRCPQIISVIHPDNSRSPRVAVTLGMRLERQIVNPVLNRWVTRRVNGWHRRADPAPP